MPNLLLRILRKVASFLLKKLPTGKVSDLLLWPISRRLFGNYSEIVSPDNNFKLRAYGDTPDMISKSLLFMSDYKALAWEPVTARLVKILSPQMSFAAVAGAHIGYYPIILAANNPNAKIYAFEPNPFNYKRLVENINLNKLRNVECSPLALGEKEEQKKMFFDFGQSAFADSSRNHNGEGVVSVMPLDDFLKDKEGGLDLMVLDAEGHEPFILKGAESTIKRSNPDIIFEVNPVMLKASGSDTHELLSFVRGFGYELFIINDDYENYPNNVAEPEIRLIHYNDTFLEQVQTINVLATKNKEKVISFIK